MKQKVLVTALVLAIIAGIAGKAPALRSYGNSFNTTYGTAGTAIDGTNCMVCHPGGNTGSFTPYADAYVNANYNFAAIANLDSDGDGFSNAVEIAARTFPGDASSHPVAADTTAPVVTGFAIPPSSASLIVPITTFTTDNTGVTGYLVTETSAKPLASAAGWSANVPASYTFASAGSKMLYAWAKDAAGNVSASLSDTTTITLPDTTAPVVTGFAIPTSSASLTVPITTFTTDNTGVTGYLLTETSSIPLASAAGWSANVPASYTFASAGSKTLYAWAKDGAGNVSVPLNDTTTITLPDTTAPAVTGFSIPVTSASLTVPITTFTTDNTGVTGYLLTETSSIPLASAASWSANVPASYTFASAGSKTLYAWAKDGAGNVSVPLNDTTTITLPDTTAPVVTGFAIPVTSASLIVPITTFTTDNTGVAGYLVTESSTTPSASAAGWSANVPASYTFASAGSKTLYAWAKDGAGNVSVPLNDTTTITLPDTTAPVVTGFAIPVTSASLIVPITTFTTDNTGVAGYLVTESSTTPSASAAGWSANVPASYTFASAGSKTLYAWAKDGAGNVSVPLNDTTTITLPDTTAPAVTGFSIPVTSASLIVPITTFTTDNTGVTGYLVTESSSIPLASAAGWSANVPASYTFASAGSKTLYAWAKDAAGNVSVPLNDTTTITLPDTTAPVVTGFSIPATSTSLTVPITTFTTDGMGVTGYLVTETSTTPSASAAGWSATSPASYTFASAGSKMLYAWVKDAAGNIGGAISTVVITASDATAPVITGFAIPASSASLTVAISTFTATDIGGGVTGYMATETSTTPTASASGWRTTAPASYTFASAGSKTLYAWVKDAAGNIGGAISSTVITIASDSGVPVVTRFEIPSRSSSRTVPISAFTATDDVRVTGYIVTNSSTRPSLSASGWRSTPPASYTFSSRTSSGDKRLYAWAKDATGKISASVSRVVSLSVRSSYGERDDDEEHDD